ncbi:MAG: hypothetical protein PHY34_04825 [Patescibacteria group bacterium]|nr:hypothetical protein [Patescibacteria group bacterium]MDD5715607.1 hypothetical protein [Patescibacteria group bacterium]
MNNQKGFVHWVIVILISGMAVGCVAAAWYYEKNKDVSGSAESAPIKTINNKNSQSSREPLHLTTQPIMNPNTLSITACQNNLQEEDANLYEIKKNVLQKLHPELQAINAGSLCTLSNGMTLLTYSYQETDAPNEDSKGITVFDENDQYVNELKSLNCTMLGDNLAPHIKSLVSGTLKAYCWSSDAAIKRYEEFNISLTNFTAIKTVSEEGSQISLENYLSMNCSDTEDCYKETYFCTIENCTHFNPETPRQITNEERLVSNYTAYSCVNNSCACVCDQKETVALFELVGNPESIDTTPWQEVTAQDGSYTFKVPSDWIITENISAGSPDFNKDVSDPFNQVVTNGSKLSFSLQKPSNIGSMAELESFGELGHGGGATFNGKPTHTPTKNLTSINGIIAQYSTYAELADQHIGSLQFLYNEGWHTISYEHNGQNDLFGTILNTFEFTE